MKQHHLLQRQLNRIGLSWEQTPGNIKLWQEFLSHINRSYTDADQERYLSDRSIEISSREMRDLNEKLENAQNLARLGYWFYYKSEEKITFSKELLNSFKLSKKSILDSQTFFKFIHPQDYSEFKEKIRLALETGKNFEFDLRIQIPNEEIRWFHVLGKACRHNGNNQIINCLSGTAMDITTRKQGEEEISLLHQQLLVSARQAGMAEIATSVLHNAGNVLNSANVSLGILQETTKKPLFKKLVSAIEMIEENISNLPIYLSQDHKGKLLPQYIITLAPTIEKEYETIIQEINNLTKQIHHINEIVAMQKIFSGVSNLPQKIFVPEIVDSAVEMSLSILDLDKINLVKNYQDNPFAILDKAKVLQILVNLIRNAKEALCLNDTKSKNNSPKIEITIKKLESKNIIEIIIADNGAGILPENITKIFAFGFTTKENGHGFGLHSSALAAKELGGSLNAYSRGLGYGASFTLILPSVSS